MEHPDKETSIVSVAVIPKTVRFAQYIINDGELHIMKHRELRDWLISIMPSHKAQNIRELMDRFAFILLLPEEGIVEEMDMNTDEERLLLREKMRNDLRSGTTLLKNTVTLKSRYISSSGGADDTDAWRRKFATMMSKISRAKIS